MNLVCGVDEAGRGPIAGPVYAAAVILDPARRVNGLADSKVLTPERREVLAARIKERAIAWAVRARERRGDRPHQHPARLGCDAPRRRIPGKSFPMRPGSTATCARTCRAGARDRGRRRHHKPIRGLDPRQDGARRRDVRAARPLRSTASTSTRATPPPSTCRRSGAWARARSTARASTPSVYSPSSTSSPTEGMAESRPHPQLPAVLRGDEARQHREAASRTSNSAQGA